MKEKSQPRIIAFYLPQFHHIPENDGWWGKGFTEWTNVKRASPFFEGHEMPYLPHPDIGFYDLGEEITLVKQAEMAKSFGVSGFCFYHYWFKGKLLLEKPLLQFLKNPKIDIKFCLCWANESWTRNWNGGNKEILQMQDYGGLEDWIDHFDWLTPFLQDKRAIHFNGSPLILVYRVGQINHFNDMIAVWRNRAREVGIGNICIGGILNFHKDSYEIKNLDLDMVVEFEPFYSLRNSRMSTAIRQEGNNTIISYPEIITSCREIQFHSFQVPGACPRWDNTPRHLTGGATIFTGCSPSLFKNQLLEKFRKLDCQNPFVFVNAWNEWGEGCALEPEAGQGYAYLEALKEALQEWKNFEGGSCDK
ncbi:glycoside hydrolase family 99-like domain-containing protein [Treponema sp. J25]|uniref:glycosyltransferase WbsX family protein n=1 Tax=Treponema sp. J25 TaxID=2094121 RepID=UPI00104A088B|nr:glycoside hydrolase family 99-like domain-containing protein [Treponema sp. J25]MCX7656081.1 glycoside hydrolase family 99-like domain-containing protein [Treponemataceae bacterium]TCW60257.1 glycosyl transferase [Treponema sp. J25]